MTYRNAQFKNSGNDEGDVVSFFEDKMRNLIQKNGGNHTFSFVTEDFHDKDVPMAVGTKTRMKLTHSSHVISQIEKGFVSMTVKVWLQTDKALNLGKDTKNALRIFVGFKNAVEIIDNARFWCDNRMTDYNQDEMIRESFAYNSIKPDSAKGNSRFSSSTWENVKNFRYCVCGKFIEATLFNDTNEHEVELELVFPFTDQLALQAWQLYPNKICGEIEEEIKTSLNGLVWAMIPYDSVAKTIEKQTGAPIGYTFEAGEQIKLNDITNKFTQINGVAKIVTKFAKADGTENIAVALDNVRLTATRGEITKAVTNLAGFGLNVDAENALKISLAKAPIYVPAQELKREIFENKATNTEMNVTKSIALHNVTNITMMFPRRSNECTCFENIMYRDVQLTVNKRQYPDTPFENTWDGRFCHHMLIANELDGMIQPTAELARSYTQPLNASNGTAHKNCRDDATSFGINFQMERSNGGYVFDGFDSDGSTVTVNFRGHPAYPGQQTDTYYYIDGEANTHPMPPEAWLCSDTYWIWTANGIEYKNARAPAGYF